MQQHELLTIPEFAASIRVTQACIRRWVRERRVTAVKLGRLVRIPATEVERLVQLGTRAARKCGGQDA